MKKLLILTAILAAATVAFADPTATPTDTPEPTPTPTATHVVQTVPVSEGVTIGTGSTRVVSPAALENAVELILSNCSDAAIDLNIIGGAAVLNKGIRLAVGGTISWNRADGNWPSDGVQAISAAGSKVLCVSVR